MEFAHSDIKDQIKDVRKAKSSLRSGDGGPIYFERIAEIELYNGTLLYGCTECKEGDEYSFISDSRGAVGGHLGWSHNPNRKPRGSKAQERASLSNSLVKLRDLVDVLIDQAADENASTWKARAQKAEKTLTSIQRRLKGLGISEQAVTPKDDEEE